MRIFAAAPADAPVGRGQRGFTLVELMMVLAVLALAATVVLLTLPAGSARVQDEADRLAVRIAALRDLAIVEGRPMALVVRPSGYGFERRLRGEWSDVPGRSFADRAWPQGVALAGDGGTVRRIAFDPAGMTGARQTLALTDGEVTARLSISATGEVVRGE